MTTIRNQNHLQVATIMKIRDGVDNKATSTIGTGRRISTTLAVVMVHSQHEENNTLRPLPAKLLILRPLLRHVNSNIVKLEEMQPPRQA